MPATPPPLANPAAASMSNFMDGLKSAGMDTAVETEKAKAAGIAPTETPPPATPPEQPKPEPAKETPAPPAKPEEKPVESEEDKWPRSAKDWESRKSKQREKETALQKERDEIRSDRDRLNTEIETLRKSGPSPELETLKKERDELSEQLRIVAVENHPKFRAYYDGKVKQQLDLVTHIVGAEKAPKINELLKAADSPLRKHQLEEVFAELTPLEQTQIGTVMMNLSQINSERAGEVAKAKESFEAVKSENEGRTRAAIAKFESLFDSTIKSFQDPKTGIPAFQTRDGDDAWNSEVKQRIDSAKALLHGKSSPELIVKAALNAAAVPAILKGYQSVLEENASLKSQIKELSSATPRVDTKTTETTTETTQVARPKPGSSPMEAIGPWMKTIQQDLPR